MATVCSRDKSRREVNKENKLEFCEGFPRQEAGFYNVREIAPPFEFLEETHEELTLGGRWRPKHCLATSRVAIVIPYKHREVHLRRFLYNIHPFLQAQQLEYGIFVIEQENDVSFNRGIIKNVGYLEATKSGDYDCVIFHDVDLLPENLHNWYGCPEQGSVRHMCIAISYFNYAPLDKGAVFGGALAWDKHIYRLVNGYSNLFFGWGGEDDDLYARAIEKNITMNWISDSTGRYKGVDHERETAHIKEVKALIKVRRERMDKDGLNTLEYRITDRVLYKTFTWIKISFNYTQYAEQRTAFLKNGNESRNENN